MKVTLVYKHVCYFIKLPVFDLLCTWVFFLPRAFPFRGDRRNPFQLNLAMVTIN